MDTMLIVMGANIWVQLIIRGIWVRMLDFVISEIDGA